MWHHRAIEILGGISLNLALEEDRRRLNAIHQQRRGIVAPHHLCGMVDVGRQRRVEGRFVLTVSRMVRRFDLLQESLPCRAGDLEILHAPSVPDRIAARTGHHDRRRDVGAARRIRQEAAELALLRAGRRVEEEIHPGASVPALVELRNVLERPLPAVEPQKPERVFRIVRSSRNVGERLERRLVRHRKQRLRPEYEIAPVVGLDDAQLALDDFGEALRAVLLLKDERAGEALGDLGEIRLPQHLAGRNSPPGRIDVLPAFVLRVRHRHTGLLGAIGETRHFARMRGGAEQRDERAYPGRMVRRPFSHRHRS